MRPIDVQHLAEVAAAHAASADRDGQLHPTVVDAVLGSGLLAHFVPGHWGGAQGTFTDSVGPLIQVGQADASAGWCAALMTSAARMATHLPPEGQQALWSDGPDVMIAATLKPAGTATPVSDGWILDGQWPYVSGITHCRWVLLSTTTSTDKQFMLVPQKSLNIQETWNAVGLRATGTHTLRVDNTFVPATHCFTGRQLTEGRSGTGRPVPHDAVSGIFFTAPMLGAAQCFLDLSQQIRRRRAGAANGTGPDLTLGRSVGNLGAAEALLRHTAFTADTAELDPESTARCRIHHATVADLLSRTVTMLFRESGTQAVDDNGPLARLWRDINTGLMHPAINLAQVMTEYAPPQLR